MKDKASHSTSKILRQKAEELLKNKLIEPNNTPSELDILKLIHELDIQKIELELQNEELLLAKKKAEADAEKYTNLYDFAPSGYFTLSQQGEIIELNFSTANLLGKKRSFLLKKRFNLFVSDQNKSTFNIFLEDLFETKTRQTCELTLTGASNIPTYVYLTGIVNESGEECLLTMADISNRKKAEAETRANEENYRTLFESNRDSITIVRIGKDGKTGNFIKVNPATIEVLGFSETELLSMGIRDLESLSEKDRKVRVATLKSQGKIKFETTIKNKKGNLRMVEIESIIINYENETAVMNITRDITERKQTEDNIRKAQENLTTILEAIPDLLFEVDLEGRIYHYQAHRDDLLAIPASVFMGKLFQEVLPSNVAKVIMNAIEEANKKGWSTGNQYSLDLPQGKHWFELSVSPIKESSNKEKHFILLARDITERKKAEESLQKSQEKLRGVFDLANSGILLTDLKGKYLLFNNWCAESLGYTRQELNKLTRDDLTHPDDLERSNAFFKQLIDGKIDRYQLEKRYVRKDKSFFWAELSVSAIKDKNNKVVNAIGILNNITERKEIQKALYDSERFANATFDALSAHIAILDENGLIISVNNAWHKFMESNTPEGTDIIITEGFNYLTVCQSSEGQYSEEAPKMIKGIRSVMNGETTEFSLEYPCHSPTEKKWFNARVTRFAQEGQMRIVVAHENITERMLAEEKLKQSEARLIAAQVVAKIGSWETDFTFTDVIWSKENCKIFGLAPEATKLSLEEFFAIVHPEDRTILENTFVNSINKNTINSFVHRIITPDNILKYVEERWEILCDSQGKPYRAVGTSQDITDRKQAEELVLQSTTRFSSIINSSPVAMALNDEQLNITYLNYAFVAMFGYTLEEIPTLNDWFPKAYPEPNYRKKITKKWFSALEKVKQTGEEFTPMEVIIRCKNGSDKTIMISTNPLLHSYNSEYLINLYDITERKLAEHALENEKRRLAVILIGTGAGTWEWNIQTGATVFNERWANIIGYTLEELTPFSIDTWRKYIHPGDLKHSEEMVEKHCQGELDYYESEFRMKHKNGEWVWILDRGKINEWDLDGKPLLMSGTHLDITKRKLAEEKLIESENLLQKTQTLANLGSYSMDLVARKFSCTPILDKIFGIDSYFDKTLDNWMSIINPESRLMIKDYLYDEVIGKKNDFNKECKIIKKDSKEERWIHGIGEITYNDEGQPIGIIGSVQDITERKQIEQNIIENQKIFRAILDNAPLGIWMTNGDGSMKFVNKIFCDAIGISEEQFIGVSHYAELYEPEIGASCIASDLEALKKDEPNISYEKLLFTDGLMHDLEIIKRKIIDEHNGSYNLIGIAQDITERKSAEKTLRESEEKYRGLVENSPDGVVIYIDSKIVYINDEGIRMLRAKNKEEILGKPIFQFIHPDSVEDVVKRMKDVVTDNYLSTTVEEKFISIDGIPFDVEIKGIPTIYDHKNAVQVIVHDITLRKQSSLELNKINRVYALISQINNLIIRTHSQKELFQEICDIAVNFGKFRMSWIGLINDNHKIITESFAGYENGYFTQSNITTNLDEPEGRGPTGIATREGRTVICNDIANDKIMKPWRKDALERGYSSLISIPITVRNKTIGAFNLYSQETNFFSSEEEILLLEKIILNISFALEKIQIEEDRKHTEEKIRQLSRAVEQSPVSIVITNTKGDIEYVNPKFTETTGYSFDEVVGQNPRVLKSGHTKPNEYKELWETLATGNEWHGEFHNIRKDGEFYWESASISPILNAQGIITHYIAIKEDITTRKKVEKELIKAKEKAEESDRLKLAFLANMSHEIRTPMNGILGFTELLKEPKLSGEEQQEYIEIIEKSGKRMLNIINDIINISKVESGQIEITLSETNINDQIKYIQTFFQPEVKQKGIQLILSKVLASKDSLIKTDREKVYAVLTNLAKNAIKFTNHGSIEFGCEKKGDYLEFFVKDTGLGISKSQKKIIFERFRQANETVSRSYEGSGLGLAISKAYVEMLGGKIWVKSEEGKGSTFYFTIPFQSENETKNEIDVEKIGLRETNEPHKIKDLKVLIVEDDAISKLLVTIAVKPFSKEILKVSNGFEAIETCRNNPDIDLVMMDINMPEMGGYEATKQIREFNKDLIIIAQTANGMQSDRDDAITAGCNDYISKPLNITALSELINKYFKK